jgi:hypothetical protein
VDVSEHHGERMGAASTRFGRLACLGLTAIVLLLYGQTIPYGYNGLDDERMIRKDHAFLKDLSHVPQAFVRDVFGNEEGKRSYYRPLLTLSLMLDTQLGGVDITAFRVTNVLLHALSTCLLLYFLMAIGVHRELALFLTIVFAVHPLQVFAVALVSGRNDPLLAVFVLSSLLQLIRFQRTGSGLACGLHILCLALALFTKESALALLVVQPLLVGLILQQDLRSGRNRALGAAWLLVVAVWFWLRSVALSSGTGAAIGPVSFLLNLPMLPQYVGKIFFPFNLSLFPTIPDTGFVYGMLALGITIAALVCSREVAWGRVVFGGAWFLAFLLPSLTVGGTPGFEQRMYLPLVGFMVVLCETDLLERADPRSWRFASVACVVIIGFFAISFFRCHVFRDFESFWQSAVQGSPHSRLAHLFYGGELEKRGRLDEAESLYRAYLARDASKRGIHHGLALVLATQGRFAQAERHLLAELKIDPGFTDAQFYLGVLYEQSGRASEAVEIWRQILENDPSYVSAYWALLDHYRARGDRARARQVLKAMRRQGIAGP